MSIYLGRVSTFPCFILYIVSKQDQTNDIHLSGLSTEALSTYILTNTHTRLTALCPGLPGWAGTRKVEPIWTLLKQEAVSGSGWGICSRQITTPAPHHSSFVQAGCPSCRPTNSVKSLKALKHYPLIGVWLYVHTDAEVLSGRLSVDL